MLDDHILYEEMCLPGYRGRAFWRWLRFAFYSFLWFVLAAAIFYGFYSGNYRKEWLLMQITLVVVGLLFLWGLVHALLVQIRYLREMLTPHYRVYRRKIISVEFLSKANPRISWVLGVFNVGERTQGYELLLNEPVMGEERIGSQHLKNGNFKTWIRHSFISNKPVFVVVGAYSGRIWDVREQDAAGDIAES